MPERPQLQEREPRFVLRAVPSGFKIEVLTWDEDLKGWFHARYLGNGRKFPSREAARDFMLILGPGRRRMTEPHPLMVAVNSARICIERFRVRPQSTHLLATALRELDDAMEILTMTSYTAVTANGNPIKDGIVDPADGDRLIEVEPQGIVAGWALNDAIIDALRAEPEGPDPQRLWQAVEAWQASVPTKETS